MMRISVVEAPPLMLAGMAVEALMVSIATMSIEAIAEAMADNPPLVNAGGGAVL